MNSASKAPTTYKDLSFLEFYEVLEHMRKIHKVKDQWLLRWYGGLLNGHAVTRLQDIDDLLAESLEKRQVDREDARVED